MSESFLTGPESPKFPDDFVWGVAAAAPQVEGAAFTDGKGASIWDTFARQPGRVKNGDTLDVACDHYHLYRDDCALMAKLGIKNYRLSIAWPRVIPNGVGTLNDKGIDFYHRLIDVLLEKNITPWITMFHWDLPQALEDKGGWRSRVVVDAFADYADEIVKRYGDRVKNWITLNEILCFTQLAYGEGRKAPGAKESPAVVNQTFHHALICHGHGVRAVREHGGAGARVGLTDNAHVSIPIVETAEHIRAAEQVFSSDAARVLYPIYRGHYSDEYLKSAGAGAPKVEKTDFGLISLPTDFLGMNIYSGECVRMKSDGTPEKLPYPQHYPVADSPWLKLNARAAHWGPRLAASVFGVKSVYITENGAGYNDEPPVNGEVLDLHRLEYVRACVRELQRGVEMGVPVHGYFLWSLMDNFEWEEGYQRRFGIVYNDFKTQQRTPKASAHWYSEVIKQNRIV